jgi:hypothetical protein
MTKSMIDLYPLDPKVQDFFFKSFISLKEDLDKLLPNLNNVTVSENTISHICQIFFSIAIDVENVFNEDDKYGVQIVKNKLTKQLEIFKNDMVDIIRKTEERNIPELCDKDEILLYIYQYMDIVIEKIFPDTPNYF